MVSRFASRVNIPPGLSWPTPIARLHHNPLQPARAAYYKHSGGPNAAAPRRSRHVRGALPIGTVCRRMNASRLSPSVANIVVPTIVGCALFMQTLDSTVIATALPVIARSMNELPIRLNLAITSYLLSLAVFIPISGWVADRFGARSVFRAAIAFFTLGSIFCGLSSTLGELVLARVLQGFGGAMMVPVG